MLIHYQALTCIFKKICDILQKRAKILKKIWPNLAKNENFQNFKRQAPAGGDSPPDSKISSNSTQPSLRSDSGRTDRQTDTLTHGSSFMIPPKGLAGNNDLII